MTDLTGRTYLVTGGSRGLGRATAQAMVDAGANVVVVGRDADRLDQAVTALGPRAAACAGDLADPDLPARTSALAHERFGGLHGAMLSSGGPRGGSVLSITDEEWRQAFETVFLGTVRMCRDLAPMLGPGSAIGIVLSTTVWEPIHSLGISNGLRPGLAMLVKDLADQLGPRDIRVLGFAPGFMATERSIELSGPESLLRRHPDIPLGRPGDPMEFGRVAAFLLGPGGSYVTGTVIPVDGGKTHTP